MCCARFTRAFNDDPSSSSSYLNFMEQEVSIFMHWLCFQCDYLKYLNSNAFFDQFKTLDLSRVYPLCDWFDCSRTWIFCYSFYCLFILLGHCKSTKVAVIKCIVVYFIDHQADVRGRDCCLHRLYDICPPY